MYRFHSFPNWDLDGFFHLSRPKVRASLPRYIGLVNHFAHALEGLGIVIPDVDNVTIIDSSSTKMTGALG
jgi:hypothetical protein